MTFARRLRAYALAELAIVLAITGVGLFILMGIGNALIGTFHASGAADDVRRLVRAIDRYGGPGLDMTPVSVASLVEAELLPPRMVDETDRVFIAGRYPVVLRGALHADHGAGGVNSVPFVPRDPLSYVLSVGSTTAPVADVQDCISLFSPILDRHISRSLPPVRVTYGLIPPPAPATPPPPLPAPNTVWATPPTWSSDYDIEGSPADVVWYASPHPAMDPDKAPGPELFSRIATACHELVAQGRGVLVYYGVSSL